MGHNFAPCLFFFGLPFVWPRVATQPGWFQSPGNGYASRAPMERTSTRGKWWIVMEGLQSQRCSSIAVPRKKTWSKSLTWLVHRVSIISIFNLVPRFLVDYIMSLVNQLKRSSDRSFFGEHPRFAMPSDWVNPSDCYSRDFSWRWLVQGFRDPFLFVACEMIPNIQGNPSYPFSSQE